jgi:phosphoglycolate phosphatase-like HAD superfamily hydrolase
MHKSLIFDFDGVLADTLDDMLRYARQICSEMGYCRQPTQADLEALERMEFVEFGRQLQIPEEKVREFAQRSFELFARQPQPPGIFEGMRQAITQLSATSKIGIVTGNASRVVQGFLEHHGLAETVDVMLTADEEGSRPEKVVKAARHLGEPGDKTYVIGDAVSDIRAARKAAVRSIAVTWGHQSREKLEQARPDYIVHTPEDLVQLLERR